jgi:hypothetical protein
MKKTICLLVFVLFHFLSPAQSTNKNYVGIWKNEKVEFELKSDGTTVLQGFPATYTCQNGSITYDFGSGIILTYSVTFKGNTMTCIGNGSNETYEKVATKSGSSNRGNGSYNGKEISGEWCKFSNSTNGSYSSQTCFYLKSDGTYTYNGSSSTSGDYGSTAGQSGDAGTWAYDGTTLHINSQSQGQLNYTCTKTYYNKDVALNIDGTVFVTTENRGGW